FLLNSKKIARQLSRLNDLIGDIYYSDWKKDIQTMLAMLILTVTMILISAVVEVMSYTSYDPSLFMPYYIAEFVCIMSECQFAAVMIILKRIIQNWNVQIGAISEVDDVINLPNSLKQINKRASKTFTVSNNLKISDRSNIQSNVMRFQYLRELHVSAREVAESVNSAYSLLLLLSTAIMFLSLTHILYFIFMDFVVQKNSLLCNETPNISYFIWLFYYVLRLIWLVYFPCFAAKEANRTAIVVHKLLGQTNDLVLREEIQQFSLQLLHEKVKFTACGFFPLDFTLLYSIVGAVTTYLVILIQFQLALPDSKKNTTHHHYPPVTTPSSSENHYAHQT
ncbi:hypothetical protein L798_04300, partial [Zootermopsis nevadensis]